MLFLYCESGAPRQVFILRLNGPKILQKENLMSTKKFFVQLQSAKGTPQRRLHFLY